MKKKMENTAGIAICVDCQKYFNNPKNLMAMAAKHAKAYNHKVIYWIKVDGYYDARKEKENETGI